MTDNFYLFKRMFQVGTLNHVLDSGERPPYPIIMEKPTPGDVVMNMGLPEWTPGLLGLPLGGVIAFAMTRDLALYPLTRRRAFALVWGSTAVFGFWMGYKGSYYKLTGFENNGLVWRTPEQYQRNYQFTDEMKGSAFSEALKRDDIEGSKMF